MTAPAEAVRYACPECGDTRIGEWRNEVAIRNVEAWRPDGTPAKLGEVLDRIDEGHATGSMRYTCFCGADFEKPKRIIEEAAHV